MDKNIYKNLDNYVGKSFWCRICGNIARIDIDVRLLVEKNSYENNTIQRMQKCMNYTQTE